MGTFTFSFSAGAYVEITADGPFVHTIDASVAVSISIDVNVAVVSPGDRLPVDTGSETFDVFYVGSTDIGIVVRDADGGIFYYSSQSVAAGYVRIYDDGPHVVPCFLAGTLIACAEGERPVEEIAIGELVRTASGHLRPVRWIGRRTVTVPFCDPRRSFPIRISAGALGAGLPRRDLFVSPSHAVLLDGILVQACALVNGAGITQVRPAQARFTYFHLEFSTHEMVVADGAVAESYVDSNGSRLRFDNGAEFAARPGDGRPLAEPCALARVTCARQLPRRLRILLATQAAEAGYPSRARPGG